MNAIFLCFLILSVGNAWLLLGILKNLIRISPDLWKQCLLFSGCWLLNGSIIIIGDLFNIIATFLCFLAVTLLAGRDSLWKKITVSSLSASTFFSFNALRDNYLKVFLYQKAPHTHTVAVYSLDYIQKTALLLSLANTLFSLFLYAGIRKFAPDKDIILPDSLWRLLFLLTATPLGIVLCVVTVWNTDQSRTAQAPFPPAGHLILLCIALVSFVSLYWCMIVLARQQKLEQQNAFMEINRKYYEAMEQQHFEIRRLKHDLANHIQVLAALPPDQKDAYIQNLASITTGIQPLRYCADATVNAVLSVKKTIMDRYGIHSSISVDLAEELPFDKTDVCALFANALDNAVEACRKLKKSEGIIQIKSRAQKGLFCLEVTNPVPDHDRRRGHLAKQGTIFWATSKTDKKNHGFGLKSMQDIVARYDGRMELDTEDGYFHLFLYIPLPAKTHVGKDFKM